MERAAVCVDRANVQKTRSILLEKGWFDASRRPAPAPAVVGGASMMLLPVLGHVLKEEAEALLQCTVVAATLPASKGSAKQTPHALMVTKLRGLVNAAGGPPLTTAMEEEIPKRWEKHGDLAMLPEHAFATAAFWTALSGLWSEVAGAIGVNRVARRARIDPGLKRESRAVLLQGEDGWVTHTDNGVRYAHVLLTLACSSYVSIMLLVSPFSLSFFFLPPPPLLLTLCSPLTARKLYHHDTPGVGTPTM